MNWKGGISLDRKAYYKIYNKTPERVARKRFFHQRWLKTKHGQMVKKRCMKAWLSKNHDKKIAYMRWYNSLPLVKARKKNYDSKPERVQYRRDYAKSHRAMRRSPGMTVRIVQSIYEENIKKFGTLTCYLCLKKIQFGKDHLEHKTPLSRGGKNKKKNLSVSCQSCNLRKGRKTEGEYRASCVAS